jgi:hypothetical protein
MNLGALRKRQPNDIRQYAAFDPRRIKAMGRDMVCICRQPTAYKVGLIHIPEASRFVDRNERADIIAVGADVKGFKAGDVVLLPDNLDVRIRFTWEGVSYSVVHKDFIEIIDERNK